MCFYKDSPKLFFFSEHGNFLALSPISPAVNEPEFPFSQYFHNIWIQYFHNIFSRYFHNIWIQYLLHRSPLNYCLSNVTFLPLSAKVLIQHHPRPAPNINFAQTHKLKISFEVTGMFPPLPYFSNLVICICPTRLNVFLTI